MHWKRFYLYALAPFDMELVLLYLQFEEDEKNGFADTADYEHLKRLALDRGIIPNSATYEVGIGKFDVEINAEDDEDIETFRSRYFETFNKKAFGGNKAAYIDKINSFNGVGGCKVYPLWNGGGTVKIIVLNSNYEVPSSTLINTIQNVIDPNIDGNGDGYAPIGLKR